MITCVLLMLACVLRMLACVLLMLTCVLLLPHNATHKKITSTSTSTMDRLGKGCKERNGKRQGTRE